MKAGKKSNGKRDIGSLPAITVSQQREGLEAARRGGDDGRDGAGGQYTKSGEEYGREGGVHDIGGDQLLPPVERYGAVADTGDLSDFEEFVPFGFFAARADHADVSSDGVAAAAVCGDVCGPEAEAVFTGGRDGVHAGWTAAAVEGVEFRDDSDIERVGGGGIVGISSRVVARGAHGVRRTARTGAIAVSGGREYGVGCGAAAGGVHCCAAWAT